MQSVLLTPTIILVITKAQAQSNYSITNSKHFMATCMDISNSGIPIATTNVESGTSSTSINGGFNFNFNGTVFTQCMTMQME